MVFLHDSSRLKEPAMEVARAALVVELGTKKLIAPLDVLLAGVSWDIVEAVKLGIDDGGNCLEELTAALQEDEENWDGGQRIWTSGESVLPLLDVAVVLFPRLDPRRVHRRDGVLQRPGRGRARPAARARRLSGHLRAHQRVRVQGECRAPERGPVALGTSSS